MEKTSPVRGQKKVGRQYGHKECVQRHCNVKQLKIKQHTGGYTTISGKLEFREQEGERWTEGMSGDEAGELSRRQIRKRFFFLFLLLLLLLFEHTKRFRHYPKDTEEF